MSKRATRFTHLFAISGIAAASILVLGFSGGITGMTQKNGSGCTCHGPSNSGVTVEIVGPSTLTPGEKGNYLVTIAGGPLAAAGVNVAVSNGTLEASTGGGLQLISGELTHQTPRAPASGTTTFNFAYTAPSTPGSATLFATGNSVNLLSGSGGDAWNHAPNKTITVSSATSVADEAVPTTMQLEQNYPNPFNPMTIIDYRLAIGGAVRLSVVDLAGREVAALVNEEKGPGSHTVAWDASDMPSGVYVYRLQAGNEVRVRKMTLLK